MILVLEFYVESSDRQPVFMDHFTTEDVLLEEAKLQAASILRNVKFERGLANLCVIRDTNRGVLGQVRLSAQDRRAMGAYPPSLRMRHEAEPVREKMRSRQ